MSVTREDVQRWTREEVRRIFDAGLMYTEQAEKKPLQVPEDVLSKFPGQQRKHLTLKDGAIYTELVSHERWVEINETAKSLGYKWVRDVENPKNSRWVKP